MTEEIENIIYKYIQNKEKLNTIEELNTYLNKLSDDDFEILAEYILNKLKEDNS
jgi:hypothetical protein